MSEPFKPNCRYGHGDLMLVLDGAEPEKYGYLSQADGARIFSGNLFVCAKCGYTELFDDDIEATVSRQKGSP